MIRAAYAISLAALAVAVPSSIAFASTQAAPDALFAGETRNPALLAERAYVWGMPLVEAGLIRERFISPSDIPASPLNRFAHRRKLAGPEMKAGVGPNNDTVYSLAWIDLSEGPLVLSAPDFGNRYYTFSINLADSSGNQSLGQRTHGGKMPPLFIHGPDYKGPIPKDMVDVPSTTRFVNIAGRILVRGPEEYEVVHALQDQIRIIAWKDWQSGRRTPAPPITGAPLDRAPAGSTEAMTFFYRLGGILRQWSIAPQEAALVRSFRAIGLDPRRGFEPARLNAANLNALEAGYAAGKERVKAQSLKLGVQQNGWTTNYLGPRFGEDYLLRAAVAKDQIYVTIPEEAVYPIGRVDAEGRPLTGSCRYRITFAQNALPPVDAFWSITAYNDQGHMIPNEIGRYSVGDRTSGLVTDTDGSVTILLADAAPEGRDVNWLPTGDGPFYLMMRLYRPKQAVLSQQWSPPAIHRMGACSGNSSH